LRNQVNAQNNLLRLRGKYNNFGDDTWMRKYKDTTRTISLENNTPLISHFVVASRLSRIKNSSLGIAIASTGHQTLSDKMRLGLKGDVKSFNGLELQYSHKTTFVVKPQTLK
jgi:hypothetical protein